MRYLMMWFLLLATPMLAQSRPKPVAFNTGEDYLQVCEAVERPSTWQGADVANASFCDGYMTGFIQGLQVSGHVAYKRDLRCLPNTATNAHFIHIVLQFVREHPTTAKTKHVTWQLAMALSAAYPCSGKTGG